MHFVSANSTRALTKALIYGSRVFTTYRVGSVYANTAYMTRIRSTKSDLPHRELHDICRRIPGGYFVFRGFGPHGGDSLPAQHTSKCCSGPLRHQADSNGNATNNH